MSSREERIAKRAAEIKAAREAGVEPPRRRAGSFWARFLIAGLVTTVPVAWMIYRLMVHEAAGGRPRSLFAFLFG